MVYYRNSVSLSYLMNKLTLLKLWLIYIMFSDYDQKIYYSQFIRNHGIIRLFGIIGSFLFIPFLYPFIAFKAVYHHAVCIGLVRVFLDTEHF